MLTKQPWPALTLHNTHNIWREQNTGKKSERKQTTSSAGSAALSPLAGGSGRGIAAMRAAFRTSAGRVTEALAMLSDERTAQNKTRWYMTSRGMKLKTAI